MKRCDKYRDWLTDAALGSLAPGREPELLAHAAECDACREAYDQVREASAFADAIDRGVASLVSGEPSPHFNSRLRARIAGEASASRIAWRAWAPIAGMAAAVAVVLAVFVLRLHEMVPAAPAVPAMTVNRPAPASSPTSSRALSPDEAADSRVPNHALAAANQPSRTPRASSSEPEVLVDPGELAAVIHFADAIRAGRIDGAKLVADEQQLEAPLEIKPLEIAPLSPPQPDSSASSDAPTSHRSGRP